MISYMMRSIHISLYLPFFLSIRMYVFEMAPSSVFTPMSKDLLKMRAYDVCLVNDDIQRIFCIIMLAMLSFSPGSQHYVTQYWQVVSQKTGDGCIFHFSETAGKVGIIRLTKIGSMANVLARKAVLSYVLF